MKSSQQPEFQQNMHGQLPNAVNQPVFPTHVPHTHRVTNGFLSSPQPHLIAPVSQMVPYPQPMVSGLTPCQMAHIVPFPVAGSQAAPQNVKTLPSNHITGFTAQQYMPVGDGPLVMTNSHRLPKEPYPKPVSSGQASVSQMVHSVPVPYVGSQLVPHYGNAAPKDQITDIKVQQFTSEGEDPLVMAKTCGLPTVPYPKPIPVSEMAHSVPVHDARSLAELQNGKITLSDLTIDLTTQQSMPVGECPLAMAESHIFPTVPYSKAVSRGQIPVSQMPHSVPIPNDGSRSRSKNRQRVHSDQFSIIYSSVCR